MQLTNTASRHGHKQKSSAVTEVMNSVDEKKNERKGTETLQCFGAIQQLDSSLHSATVCANTINTR
jgi:hypothetical protein